MDLPQISSELLQLYEQQLTTWEFGKARNLNDADFLEYDRRKERIRELQHELERLSSAREHRTIRRRPL
jgi:hypothetical protein